MHTKVLYYMFKPYAQKKTCIIMYCTYNDTFQLVKTGKPSIHSTKLCEPDVVLFLSLLCFFSLSTLFPLLHILLFLTSCCLDSCQTCLTCMSDKALNLLFTGWKVILASTWNRNCF